MRKFKFNIVPHYTKSFPLAKKYEVFKLKWKGVIGISKDDLFLVSHLIIFARESNNLLTYTVVLYIYGISG